jgi:glycine cleavage system H protein
MNIPTTLKYTASDEWLAIEGNMATIGVTDFAQGQLNDIVYVEITAESGDTVSKNTSIATLESVKAAADVNTPVSGVVKEVNEKISSSPEMINSAPYDAWLIKVEMNNSKELNDLMDAEAYKKYCEERSH